MTLQTFSYDISNENETKAICHQGYSSAWHTCPSFLYPPPAVCFAGRAFFDSSRFVFCLQS